LSFCAVLQDFFVSGSQPAIRSAAEGAARLEARARTPPGTNVDAGHGPAASRVARPSDAYDLAVRRTWILQANPNLYDIDAALQTRPVIYWRVPQYTNELKPGDRALIWRAGKQAGFVGWGVFLADPQHYDLSGDDDPSLKTGFRQEQNDYYAPICVWPGGEVAKGDVAAVLAGHRIVTAPMGTVFPLDSDNLAAVQPLLAAHGYDLARDPEEPFVPLPVLPEAESKPKPTTDIAPPGAKITPALFLLSSTPERPTQITIEGDALRLLLVEREALKALDESWDAVGIYLLIGKAQSEGTVLSIYVGKATGTALADQDRACSQGLGALPARPARGPAALQRLRHQLARAPTDRRPPRGTSHRPGQQDSAAARTRPGVQGRNSRANGRCGARRARHARRLRQLGPSKHVAECGKCDARIPARETPSQ